MSSSRSIAAARQKRAGEPPPVVGRPQQLQPQRNVKIQSQQQQQQSQSQTRPSSQQVQQKVGVAQFNGKLTISDAVGLITLRLGRIEQYIQNSSQEEKEEGKSAVMDNSILMTIINRLDSLEKREDKFQKLEKELKELKDLIVLHINKFESTNLDIENRFQDIESGFIELEKNIISNTEENIENELFSEQTNIENIKLEIVEKEEESSLQTILSEDLKNIMINS
jgi:hypothetical protein